MSFVKCNYCKAYTVCLDRAEFRISTYILLALNCLRCGNCVTRSVGVADKTLAKSRYLPRYLTITGVVQPPNGTAGAKWYSQGVSQMVLPWS